MTNVTIPQEGGDAGNAHERTDGNADLVLLAV